MILDEVVVALIGEESPAREAIGRALEAAGAHVERCTEADAIAKVARGVEAIVFVTGREPERLSSAARALGSEPATRALVRLVVVDGAIDVARLVAFGPCAILADAPSAAIVGALDELLAPGREARAAQNHARTLQEELCAANDQLEALREQAMTLAHDARALFGVIMGYACNLRDGLAGPIGEAQRQHAVNIVEASSDAAALVERHAKAVRRAPRGPDSSGTLPLTSRRRPQDMAELVRTVTAMFAGVAAQKRIRLEVSSTTAQCWCDVMQVKQALVNLITNALKFTPSGGAVAVELRSGAPAATRGRAARRDVEIVVRDTGPGIPVEERARVFERGARLERDRGSPGMGIGLAVVREVVELHGGAVRVEEAPGGGAAFVLELPTDPRTRERSEDAATSAPHGDSA